MIYHLLELTSLIAEYGLRPELIRRKVRRNDAVGVLFVALLNGEVQTEQDLEKVLRSASGAMTTEAVALLKSRLKRRMLNSILFLDLRPEKNSEQTIQYLRVQRRLAQLKVLVRLGADRNIRSEANKGYRIAREYELTAEALEFAVMLRAYYVGIGDKGRFERYARAVTELLELHAAELEADAAYRRFIIHYVKRMSYTEQTASILQDSIATYRRVSASNDSMLIRIVGFRLRIYDADMSARYSDVYAIASEALAYLSTKPKIATSSDIAEFALYQLSSCVYTRDVENGIVASTAATSYFPAGTFNWFVAKEQSVLFFLHIQHYEAARTALSDATRNASFKLLPEIQQQRWHVYELFLLFATGELRNMLSRRTKRSVALRELMALSSQIRGDRAGFGFSVRLIYILYLIEKGSFDELTESIESFRIFVSRYMKPSVYPRSNSFAKLIVLAERYSYNYLIVKTKAQKYLQRMQSVIASPTEMNENIQILPYELIWDHVLESLRKHQRSLRTMAKP